jgi:hypothetical protein
MQAGAREGVILGASNLTSVHDTGARHPQGEMKSGFVAIAFVPPNELISRAYIRIKFKVTGRPLTGYPVD